jgi:hypothetical protein
MESTGPLDNTTTFKLVCSGDGGTSPEVSVTVTVTNPADTTPPTVSIVAPLTGDLVSGYSSPIAAAASDEVGGSGINYVQFVVGGKKVGKDTSSPYSTTWDTSAFPNGSSHNLRADAYDKAGNRTNSAVITVTVNNLAPTMTLKADPTEVPLGGSSTLTWSSTNADICNASDGWSGDKNPPAGGSDEVGPLNQTTDFTLTCSGPGGDATVTVTVTVTNPPPPPPPPPSCPPDCPPPPPAEQFPVGDLNHDRKVDVLDLSTLLSHYGTAGPVGDIDGRNGVEVIDLSILLSRYGQ